MCLLSAAEIGVSLHEHFVTIKFDAVLAHFWSVAMCSETIRVPYGDNTKAS